MPGGDEAVDALVDVAGRPVHAEPQVGVGAGVGSVGGAGGDVDAVAAEFPYGTVTVTPVEGGLRTPNGTGAVGADTMVCAVAVIRVGW